MVSADAIRTGVGIAGNVVALGMFLSPLPTFVRICKKKSVEEFSIIPYVATLLNCLLWVVYGLPAVHPKSTLVLTINGAGTGIELSYIILYLLFSTGPKRLKALFLFFCDLLFVSVVIAIVLLCFHTHDQRSLFVGILCVIFCIMMYVAPLSVMKLVIQTKSVEFMPLSLSIASFLNGLCWTAYALIRFDIYITIPNTIGLVFAITQLILQALYYKSTKRQIMQRKMKSEVVLTNITIGDNVEPQQVVPGDNVVARLAMSPDNVEPHLGMSRDNVSPQHATYHDSMTPNLAMSHDDVEPQHIMSHDNVEAQPIKPSDAMEKHLTMPHD